MIRAATLLLLVASFGLSCSKASMFGQESNPGDALARCNTIMKNKKYKTATRCYENLRSRFAGTHASAEAEIRMADIYFEDKEYLMAAESYRSFAKLHPTHHRLPYIYHRAGLSYLKESPKAIDRDQEYLDLAIDYFEVGMNYFPGSDYYDLTRDAWKKARRRVAKRHLYVANFYFKQKEYRSAIPRYAKIADDYKDLGLDEKALYQMAQAYLKLDKKNKAFEVTAHLKSRYPKSHYLDELAHDLGLD